MNRHETHKQTTQQALGGDLTMTLSQPVETDTDTTVPSLKLLKQVLTDYGDTAERRWLLIKPRGNPSFVV